jgi:hypothetical protein
MFSRAELTTTRRIVLFLVTWAIQNLRVTELTSSSLQLSWDKEAQFKEYEVKFKRFSRAKPKSYVVKENRIRFRRTKSARRYFLSVQGNARFRISG